MMTNMKRARWVVVTGLIAVGTLAACDRVKTELLLPQNPGLIDPSAVTTPTAALALRIGAIGSYNQVVNCTNGECAWAQGGLLTDEFKNADFQVSRADVDQRNMSTDQAWNYAGTTQARGFIRDAIDAMKRLSPDSASMIGELYAELAFFEMTLADTYCNGIPLGHTINGVQTLGAPLTTQQVYDSASAHLDTALQIITGADAQSIFARRAAQVYKARVLVMKGQFAAAAALVSVANVPTTYQYDMAFSSKSGTNGLWTVANSIARITVGDSFDIVNGVNNVIANAMPFASANDPRLPILSGQAVTPKVGAEDQSTPVFLSQLWAGQFDPLVLASGIDARLIEAEAALNNNDIPGMMTILNALRAAKPSIAAYLVPAMGPVPGPAPTTKAAAATLFFREKAFWTFGRGQRLPDLRRMIRLYGFTEDQVFPKGVFFKGGVYGTDVNFPVPTVEQNNPLFSACMDRKA
jgi:hypothetical protein